LSLKLRKGFCILSISILPYKKKLVGYLCDTVSVALHKQRTEVHLDPYIIMWIDYRSKLIVI